MRIVGWFLGFIHKAILVLLIFTVGLSIVFIGYKGNQPMSIPQAPKGITYFEFIQDRIDAAKTVQPSRCGWGMFLTLSLLGPIYSFIYTDVAIHPNGFLAKVTAPDPDIPNDVENASWNEVPDIWWKVIERLSWTMLAKQKPGCNMRSVQVADK